MNDLMKHPNQLLIPKYWLVLLVLTQIVPWAIVGGIYLRDRTTHTPTPSSESASKPTVSIVEPQKTSTGPYTPIWCNDGPWGKLEKSDIIISPPIEFVSEMSAEKTNLPWHFPKMARDDIQPFLKKCGLTDEQRAALVEHTQYDASTGDYTIKAPNAITTSLNPEARANLYHYLGSFDVNVGIEAAFRFTGSEDEWCSKRVPQRVNDAFKKAMYRNGSTLFFADTYQLMALTETVEEQRQTLKMMSRNKTIMLKLKVDNGMNVEPLVNYWGKGGRAKDIRPLLESLALIPNGQEIDIVHLLPPFARQRIYTYANPSFEAAASGRNCYWTAMNFFNAIPDDKFTNLEYVSQIISRDYVKIFSAPQFGDIIFFGKSEKEILHAAVYIADDILFTKNGSLESRPWMLMHMDKMKEYYYIPKEKLWTSMYRNRMN